MTVALQDWGKVNIHPPPILVNVKRVDQSLGRMLLCLDVCEFSMN